MATGKFPDGVISMEDIRTAFNEAGNSFTKPFSLSLVRGLTMYNPDGSTYTVPNTNINMESFRGKYYLNPAPLRVTYTVTGSYNPPTSRPTPKSMDVIVIGGGGGGGGAGGGYQCGGDRRVGGGGGGGGSGYITNTIRSYSSLNPNFNIIVGSGGGGGGGNWGTGCTSSAGGGSSGINGSPTEFSYASVPTTANGGSGGGAGGGAFYDWGGVTSREGSRGGGGGGLFSGFNAGNPYTQNGGLGGMNPEVYGNGGKGGDSTTGGLAGSGSVGEQGAVIIIWKYT
jgi:hypothetical protein